MSVPEQRLETEKNIWLATTRPDGRPHLVPIWFVWSDGQIFILTAQRSVKARNLAANPRAVAALENGNAPAIAECAARLIEKPYPGEVAAAFKRKYDWDITRDGEYDTLFALAPLKWLSWTV